MSPTDPPRDGAGVVGMGRSLAAVLVVSGILVVGYAPFLHAYNLVYYGAILPCRSVGMAWLSTPFTIAVPLLGFALVALGAGFVDASRTAGRGAWGLDVSSLVTSLELPARLLAAIALVSGLGYVMSSEVYDRVPLEGVRFTAPHVADWVTVALPASVALVLYGVGARWNAATSVCGVRVRATRGRSRLVKLVALAAWVLPVAAIARGGWDIHFDVPPGFVLVIEWALVVGLGVAWASGARAGELARLGLGLVLAELVRVCFGASATSLIFSRARDFTFYERHLFTVGRFVNGAVALVWIAGFAGCCVLLLCAGGNARRQVPVRPPGTVAPARSVVARLAARLAWAFLVLSVVWFAVSMTGLDLVRARDRWVGECATEGSTPVARLVAATVSSAQLGASWLLAMGAAHLMVSAAGLLRAALGGRRPSRAATDAVAWRTMLGAALVLCATSWVRLAWLAAQRR